MRRILAVAALGVALSVMSACADPVQDDPGASPSATQSKAAALADKKTTCDAYKALQTEFDAKTMTLAPLVMGAASDQTKIPVLIATAGPIFKDYETKLTPIAAAAGDAEVKSAIDAELASFKGINSDIAAAGTDPTKAQAVFAKLMDDTNDPQEKTKKACGIEDK